MAKTCKVILVWCCAAALLAVALAAEQETTMSKIINAPRRILRGTRGMQGPHAWSGGGGRFGPAMWPGSYGGGWGWGMGPMMWPYQENRWVSAARMDNSVERRFNMAQ